MIKARRDFGKLLTPMYAIPLFCLLLLGHPRITPNFLPVEQSRVLGRRGTEYRLQRAQLVGIGFE